MKKLQSFTKFNENSSHLILYTVVSLDSIDYQWGIEGDFYSIDKEGAIEQAKKQASYRGVERVSFEAFLPDSDELKYFIEEHDFID